MSLSTIRVALSKSIEVAIDTLRIEEPIAGRTSQLACSPLSAERLYSRLNSCTDPGLRADEGRLAALG